MLRHAIAAAALGMLLATAGCLVHHGPPPAHYGSEPEAAPAPAPAPAAAPAPAPAPTAAPAAAPAPAAAAEPACPPSHIWDGSMCRHKGKGKGARKHDFVPAGR